MDIQSAAQSGYQAINQARNRLDQAANDIAQAPVDAQTAQRNSELPPSQRVEANSAAEQTRPIDSSLVELQLAKIEAQAGTEILQADSERIGTLIDIEV